MRLGLGLGLTITDSEGGDTPPPPVQQRIFDRAIWSPGPGNPDVAVNLGTVFSVSVAGQITHVSFWKTATDIATSRTVGLFNMDIIENPVATVTTSSEPAGPRWIDVPLAAAYTPVVGTKYIAVARYPNGEYAAQASVFVSDVVNGNVTGEAASDSGFGNGRYVYGEFSYPGTGSPSQAAYWVDIIFEAD